MNWVLQVESSVANLPENVEAPEAKVEEKSPEVQPASEESPVAEPADVEEPKPEATEADQVNKGGAKKEGDSLSS